MEFSAEVLSILGVGVTIILALVGSLVAGFIDRSRNNERFDKFNERFDKFNERFDKIHEELMSFQDKASQRFDKIHEELMSFHGRIVKTETKLESQEG